MVEVVAQQQAVMAAMEAEHKQESASVEPSAFSQVHIRSINFFPPSFFFCSSLEAQRSPLALNVT